jgi:hypothetical protein
MVTTVRAAIVVLSTLFSGTLAAAEPAKGGQRPAVPPPTASEDARRNYYQVNFVSIWREDIGGYTVSSVAGSRIGGYVMPTEIWEGRRGTNKRKLGPFEFYDAVDRPDLRRKAVTHAVLQASFAVVGVGLLIAGGVYQYSHWDDPEGLPPTGWILIGAGAACAITAYAIGPSPLRSDEAERLARAHNQRLRLKLGLPAQKAARVDLSGATRLRAPVFSPRELASLTVALEL